MSMHHELAKLRAALRWRTIRRPSPPRKCVRPQLEQLETRLAPAVSLLNHFNALPGGDPPDTVGAAGPNSYIETINSSVTIYNKSTNNQIDTDTLQDFLYTRGGITPADSQAQLSDATMVYDEVIGRFVVADLDLHNANNTASPPQQIVQAPSQIDIAVSTDSNPTALDAAHWRFYQISTSEGGTSWSDYPGNLGYNHDALVITFNMFAGGVNGGSGLGRAQVDAISQSDLAAGGNIGYVQFDQAGLTLRPVTMHDSAPGGPMWFVQDGGDNKSINVVRVDHILDNIRGTNNNLALTNFNRAVNAFSAVNPPLNPDGTRIIPAANGGQTDTRIIKAAERNNIIVASQSVGVGTTQDNARWYEFNVGDINNPTVQDQGDVSAGNNTYLVYPAIDINAAGDIAMTYTQSGNDTTTDYMSAYITGRKASDAAGTMEAPVQIAAGNSNNGDGREGDFSGINVDPNDGTFWAAAEYTAGGAAATEIANFAVNRQTFFVNNGQLQIFGDQFGSGYNDSITIDVNGRGGVYANLNGEAVGFDRGQITSIYIDPRLGVNTVQINNVPANAGVDVTGDGVNHVTVGNGFSGVQGINSVVFVYNGYPTPSTTGWSTLTINDAADTVGRNATMVDQAFGVGSYQRGYITGLAPATIEWFDNSAGGYVGGVESLTIDSGEVANTFNLQEDGALYSGTYLVGNGSVFGQHDTVNIGNNGSVQGIVGYLSLSNPPGFDNITIDDSADGAARSTTITNNAVYGLAPAIIAYVSSDALSLTVKTGSGGNFISVQSTGTTTNLVGNGSSTVNVGNAGSVQGIVGTLNIENPPSLDALTIDDSADTTARTAVMLGSSTLSDGSPSGYVSGLAPATINYEYDDVSSVTVKTGRGGDTINVLATGVTTNLVGNGTPSVPDTVNVGDAGSVQGITGTLNIENPPSFDVLTIDDSADAARPTVTLGSSTLSDGSPSGYVSGLAPATINYEYDDTRSVTVMTGGGGAIVNVLATGVTTNLVAHGDRDGSDVVNVGDAGSVQGIAGTLNIEDPPSFVALTIDDSADLGALTVTLGSSTLPDGPSGSISGLAPANINYAYNDTDFVTVMTGDGPNIINVLATGVTTNLVGNGGRDSDTVNVGNGSVQGIVGTLNIDNSPSFDVLTIDDSADTTARTAVMLGSSTLSDGSPSGYVSGLAPANINYEYNDVSSVTVKTGRGGDVISVLATGVTTNLVGNGSSFAYDTVTVGNAGSVQGIVGTLNIDNSPSFDVLTIDDSADATARTATIGSSTLSDGSPSGYVRFLAPADINYEYADITSPITINGGSGGNTFVVSDVTAGPAIVLNTGAGDDLVEASVSDVGGYAPLTVNGQAGNNRLVVTGADSPTLTNVPNPTQAGAGVIDAIYSSPALMRAIAYSNIGSFGATTTTQVSSDHAVSGSVYGQQVVLTAVVSSGAGVPTGSVQFLVNGVAFGPAVALSGGTASLTTTALPAGNLLIGARFTSAGPVFANSGAASLAETVTPAPLTITADNQQAPFGGPFPVLTVHYSGFVNGDAPASLTTPPTVTTTATAASVAGNYAITASGAVDSNYAITYVSGTLTIIQPLSVLTTQTPNALQGVSTGSVLLATFTQGSATQAAVYTASVNWADGHIDTSAEAHSPLTIVVSGQTISVYGSHTYATSGKFNSSVTLFGSQTQATANPTINVAANLSSSGQIKSSASGLVYNRATKLFGGTLTLTNNGPTTLSGQLEVVFRGLPAGVVLKNATGYDADGDPYILVNIGALPPGRSVTFSLSFSNPNSVLFGYELSVFDEPNNLNA